MICQIERLYKALAPQILACLRTIGASSSKDYHLLYTLATVSYETAPTLAPLLTYRWGHHLPKAEGVKPKLSGKSSGARAKYIKACTYLSSNDSCRVMEKIPGK